jgi:hypothetical protein
VAHKRLSPTVTFRTGHGKIAFAELGKTISARWKLLSPEELTYYQQLADQDKVRNGREMKAWKEGNATLSAGLIQNSGSQTHFTPPSLQDPRIAYAPEPARSNAYHDDEDFDNAVASVLPPSNDGSLLPLEDVKLMPLTEPHKTSNKGSRSGPRR